MLQFHINDRLISIDHEPTTRTLLEFLRFDRGLSGTKEGCAEGDCGACTVVVGEKGLGGEPRYKAINSCLLILPSLHGKRIYTVEGLQKEGSPHPVQEALVQKLGSQCGYCTPGVIMSMFEACYRDDMTREWQLDDQMCGNLCRCTGYRPIREATQAVMGSCPKDKFSENLSLVKSKEGVEYTHNGASFLMPDSFEMLWKHIENNPEHRFVCGGTDLGLDITKKHKKFPCLISLEAIPEMIEIQENEEGWQVGASVPLSELELYMENRLPCVSRMLRYFGSRQIKNRATLGGNSCNASPIGDMPPVLLALDAVFVLNSKNGKRRVPSSEFFISYRQTALKPGEILSAVEIPKPNQDSKMGAYKVSKRRELDISAVAACMRVELNEDNHVTSIRLAYGGMAATPARATQTEGKLLGQEWTSSNVEMAIKSLDEDFKPLNDHRGSAWYRSKVAKNLLLGFFEESKKDGVVTLTNRHSGTVILEKQL